MSGGEQQLVAIARALVTGPEVLFAAEPIGELDTATGMSISTILRDVASYRGATVAIPAHDLPLAGMTGRRVEIVDRSFSNARDASAQGATR